MYSVYSETAGSPTGCRLFRPTEVRHHAELHKYTRSPLKDSRLFGPSLWLWTNGFRSNPASGENLLSGNLVMETGCRGIRRQGSFVRSPKFLCFNTVPCRHMPFCASESHGPATGQAGNQSKNIELPAQGSETTTYVVRRAAGSNKHSTQTKLNQTTSILSVFIISNRKTPNWASQILKANMLLICPYCLKFQIARV